MSQIFRCLRYILGMYLSNNQLILGVMTGYQQQTVIDRNSFIVEMVVTFEVITKGFVDYRLEEFPGDT